MEIASHFFAAFKTAYNSKQFADARNLVLKLFRDEDPDEMTNGLLDEETVDMYLSVLEEQKIDIKTTADLELYLLLPAREKLLGLEEEDDDDWNF